MLIVQATHDHRAVGFLSGFESLYAYPRLNAPSGWELTTPVASRAAELLATENRHGIRLILPGQPARTWSGSVKKVEIDEESGLVTISGPSHLSWLNRRLVVPTSGAEFTASGAASSAVASMISSHAGPGSAAGRQPFLGSVTTDVAGSEASIELAGRYTPLLDTIGERATAHDLSIDLTCDGRDGLGCVVRQGRQLPHIVFDEIRSVGKVSSQASEGNAFWGGAGGDGAAREFVTRTGDGASSSWDRVEGFIDVGSPNLADADELTEAEQKLDDEIEARKATSSAELVVSEHAHYRLGPDYWVGDYVAVRRGGVRRMTQVTGADIEVTSDGVSIRALVGDAWSPLERVMRGDDAVEVVR